MFCVPCDSPPKTIFAALAHLSPIEAERPDPTDSKVENIFDSLAHLEFVREKEEEEFKTAAEILEPCADFFSSLNHLGCIDEKEFSTAESDISEFRYPDSTCYEADVDLFYRVPGPTELKTALNDNDDDDDDDDASEASETDDEFSAAAGDEWAQLRKIAALRKETTQTSARSIRRSDLSLKLSVESLNFSAIQAHFQCRCQTSNCLGQIPPNVAEPFRQEFWGPPGPGYFPTSSGRRERFRKYMEEAKAKADIINQTTNPRVPHAFLFQVGIFLLCESGFLTLLGFVKDRPRLWREVKSRVSNDVRETEAAEEIRSRPSKTRNHATMYILNFISRECDKMPFSDVAVVPYTTLKQFFRDYDFIYQKLLLLGQVESDQIVSYDTFKRAFYELKGKYTSQYYVRDISCLTMVLEYIVHYIQQPTAA